MPTYEYACKACDHRFEIVQSFSEDALTTCPDCAQDALRKVYNAAGIIFKGDGWHIKDYSSSGSPTADSGSKSSESGSKSSESSAKSSESGSSSSKQAKKKKATGSGRSDTARPAAN